MNSSVRILSVILFLFIPFSVYHRAEVLQPALSRQLPLNLLLLSKDNQGNWELLTKKQLKWDSQALTFPFIEYSPKGMLINYDEEGGFFLFHENRFFDFSENQGKKASFLPKMAYPYLLMFSRQRDFVEIYEVRDLSLVLLTKYSTSNIITSYACSKNFRYLIMGTLSNDLIIFDMQKQFLTTTIHLKTPHSGVYGVGITNEGRYFALTSHNPSLLVYGSIHSQNPDQITEVSIPIRAHSQKLLQTENLFFVEGNDSWEAFDIENNSISQKYFSNIRPYPLIGAQLLPQKTQLVLLYRLGTTEYIVDVLNTKEGTLLKKDHIITHSIPIFSHIRDAKGLVPILVYDSGGLIL